MRFAARIFVLSILFFVFSIFIFNSQAFAQTNQPVNLHNYTQNVMIEVMSSMSCLLAGVDAINPNQKCLGVENGKIGPVDTEGKGAIGAMANLIAMTFYIPVNTGDYVHYLAQNFGIAKPTYAASDTPQGVGFAGAKPLIHIWTAFRNITYLFFVLVFVVIGFAIMLRVHIDPRTVMTIENQVPKIIIALLLVTFSFAIAGFLIDLMYVFIYLLANVFAAIDPAIDKDIKDIVVATNPIQAANTIGGLGDISQKTAEAAGSFFPPLFDNFFGRTIVAGVIGFLGNLGISQLADTIGVLKFAGASTIYGIIGTVAAKVVATGVGFGAGALLAPQIMGFVGGFLAFIVIIVALLVALFRLWFELLKTYVFLLLDIVLAPFWIIVGLLPGSNINFSAWLRDFAANLLAFPATIALFLLGKTFIDGFKGVEDPFVPPLIGNPAGNAIGYFIGIGVILLAPGVVGLVKAALKAPKADLSAIGQAVGAGATYPINVGRRVGQTIVGGREYEITRLENQGRTIIYGPRGRVKAFFGGIFGR